MGRGGNGGFFICLKVPKEVLWSTICKKLLNGIFFLKTHCFFLCNSLQKSTKKSRRISCLWPACFPGGVV